MGYIINQKEVNVYDQGFLYGFSLFETFMVKEDGSVFLLEEHLNRLFRSLDFFHIVMDVEKEQLFKSIDEYCKENKIQNKVMRLTVTAGNRMQGIPSSCVVTLRDYAGHDNAYSLTLSKIKKDIHSSIVNHKTSNYMENLLEGQKAAQQGFDDALFLNSDNKLAETTKCNLFFVRDGVVYTPAIECGILPGITRQWVADQCKKLNLPFVQGHFILEQLFEADEAFVTNAVMGIKIVNNVDGHIIVSNVKDTFANRLIKDYKEACEIT